MNNLQAIRNREHGFCKTLDYDFALKRLCVAKEDSWRGIVPSNFTYDFNPEPPIFSAKFANCNNYRHILAIANEDGKIALQDITKRNLEPNEQALNAPQCHFNAVFDLEWAPGQMKFVSASGDHTARLWQVRESQIEDLRTFVGHTRSVKTAAFRRNDPSVFATGGRDGAIIIWDTRANLNVDLTPRVDNCIYSGHVGGPSTPQSQRKKSRSSSKFNNTNAASSSITGLAFQDTNTLISCGAGDGVIKVWDLRRNYMVFKKEPQPKHSLPYAGCSTFKGFTNLLVDASGSRLYANCMDNTIYCYNLCSYSPTPLQRFKGLLNCTFYIKSCLSPDGKYLLSGSSDEKAYIWNLKYAEEPLVALAGHSVEVTCVAWGATNDCPIVTCSDEARHKIWRMGPESMTDFEEQENYRGRAILLRKPKPQKQAKSFMDLVSTPRTLKRQVLQNERTPSGDTIDNNAAAQNEQWDIKRTHLLESRGRRLFTSISSCIAGSSCSVSSNHTSPKMRCYNVEISPLHESNHTTDNFTSPPPRSCTFALLDTEQEVTNAAVNNLNKQQTGAIFSPTSNLPNYVMDGEAPHMAVMSPKRKIKHKVDWLTKIRKQKLMSNPRNGLTVADKLQSEESGNESESMPKTSLESPRLHSLRAAEGSPRIIATPRRRSSQDRSHPKTPTSSRRSENTTLLRFFSKRGQNERIAEETEQSMSVNETNDECSNIAELTATTRPASACQVTQTSQQQASNMAPDNSSGSSARSNIVGTHIC